MRMHVKVFARHGSAPSEGAEVDSGASPRLALVVHFALHLRQAMPRPLHHPAHRVDARPECPWRSWFLVAAPLMEDLLVALRLIASARAPDVGDGPLPTAGALETLPLPSRKSSTGSHRTSCPLRSSVRRSVLEEDLALLRGRVESSPPGPSASQAHRRPASSAAAPAGPGLGRGRWLRLALGLRHRRSRALGSSTNGCGSRSPPPSLLPLGAGTGPSAPCGCGRRRGLAALNTRRLRPIRGWYCGEQLHASSPPR